MIALPLMLFNFLSGIVGGIWLAFLGEWDLVLIGVGLAFAGAMAVSLLLLPSMIFLAPIAASERAASNKLIVLPLAVLSVGYTYMVMGIWALAIFWYFSHNSKSAALFPMLLWSYSCATGAWSYLAQKDLQAGNDQAAMSSFFNQIGCLSLMLYVYLYRPNLEIKEMAIWFGVPMALSLIIQVGSMLAKSNRY